MLMSKFKIVLMCLLVLWPLSSVAKKQPPKPPSYDLDWVLVDKEEWTALSEWRHRELRITNKWIKKKEKTDWPIRLHNTRMGWEWKGISGNDVKFENEFGDIEVYDLRENKIFSLGDFVTDREGNVIALLNSFDRKFKLSHLSAFTRLKYINFNHHDNYSGTIDFSKFELPNSLEFVTISHLNVLNIEKLAKLPNLRGISIRRGVRLDLSGLLHLKRLSFLDLTIPYHSKDENNPRSHLPIYSPEEQQNFMFNMKVKESLSLMHMELTDLMIDTFAKNNRNLISLKTGFNESKKSLVSVSFTKYLPKLRYLDMLVKVKGFSGFSQLPNLVTLNVPNSNILDINGIDKFPLLRNLNLRSNKISNISPLNKLKNLEEVDLGLNRIEKFDGFSGSINITKLDLSSNYHASTKGLEKLEKLEELILMSPYIAKLEGLSKLNNLKKVYIYFSSLKNMNGLPASLEDVSIENGGSDLRPGKNFSAYNGPLDASAMLKMPNLISGECGSCWGDKINKDIAPKKSAIVLGNLAKNRELEKAKEKTLKIKRLEALRKIKSQWPSTRPEKRISTVGK